MGPGETAQARAVANYFFQKGYEIIFCLHQEKNLLFLGDDKGFKIFLTPTPEKLEEILKREKSDFLFLFNSKMWDTNFKNHPPFPRPKHVFCFDSNWLFNSQKYSFFDYLKWADYYFILFPKKIFQMGLKKNGGFFEIEDWLMPKILPIGFVPSYSPLTKEKRMETRKKLSVKKEEKFIFCYFSGWGATHREWAFKNFLKATQKLIDRGYKIKAFYVGPETELQKDKKYEKWLITREKLSVKEYFEILSSSDLIFMHQGMGTLAQGIACQIPIICNVSLLKGRPIPRLHFAEVSPFKKLGLCEMLTKSTNIREIAEIIKKLLYNVKERDQMMSKQKRIFQKGEENIFRKIKNLL